MTHETLTQPPLPGQASRTSRGSGASLAVTIVGSVAGIALLTASVFTGVRAGAQSEAHTVTAAVDGVTALDVSVSAADVTISFGDVTDATLDVGSSDGARSWNLKVRGDTLVLEDSGRGWFGAGWLDFGGDELTASLTLPKSLEGELDAQFDLSAGDLSIFGAYKTVSLDLSAGALHFDGTAKQLTSSVSAGQSNIRVDGLKTLTADVSAGKSVVEVVGDQPDEITGSVTAGTLELEVPRGVYNVQGDVVAGDRTVDVRTSSDADSLINIDLTAGDLNIRYS